MSSRRRARLVVVGNGMAGMRAVEELLARAPDRFDITVIGAEPHPNYSRILLSAVLAGEKTLDEIVINARSWYEDHGIRLVAGSRATAIDRGARQVVLAGGDAVPYDKLLLATGSKPLAPPIPGLGLPNVRAFRDIADVAAMIEAANSDRRAVVIGGGLLGLEAAWGLKRRGMAVALVHLMPTLMERQLDAAAGELLQRDLDARGIAFFTNSQTEEIVGTDRAEAVLLADGRRIAADLVVLAVGIRPNIDLARTAALDVNRGILVGDDMATSDPDIYAVGECIEHNGQVFGLVAPIWDQAKTCGARLAGDTAAVYVPPPVFTSLKITGIDVFSAGTLAAADAADEEITLHDAKRGLYKKVILRDDKLVGSVLYGSVADGPWYVELMRDKVDVASIRDQIVFGRAFAERAGSARPQADVPAADADAAGAAAGLRWQAA
jgi:nitrite reductase (NADH) large subunit